MTLRRDGSELEIPVEDGALPAYLALPAAGHGPGVLVVHEAFGLVDHIRDVCDRLARAGFVALAPDLFRGRSADDAQQAAELVAGLEAQRVMSDLAGAAQALINEHAVDGARVGAVGFCMGGHLALLAATGSPRVAAVVNFYGVAAGLPLDLSKLEAAVLAIFAENDEFVSSEAVEALRADFDAAGKRATILVQPGVGHAFMNDSRPDRHDAAAAAEGWDRMLALLRAKLA
jgi:carboxymethylenebutenolidase